MASGTYRMVTRKLRVQRPGHDDLVVERPAKENREGVRSYQDSDEKPTLITFDDSCVVDVEGLLKLGAIVPYTPRMRGRTDAPVGSKEVGSG